MTLNVKSSVYIQHLVFPLSNKANELLSHNIFLHCLSPHRLTVPCVGVLCPWAQTGWKALSAAYRLKWAAERIHSPAAPHQYRQLRAGRSKTTTAAVKEPQGEEGKTLLLCSLSAQAEDNTGYCGKTMIIFHCFSYLEKLCFSTE